MAHYTRYGKATPSLPSEILVTKPKDVFCVVTKTNVSSEHIVFVTALTSELMPQCPLPILQEHSPPSWTTPGFILACFFWWRFLESKDVLILYIFFKTHSFWIWMGLEGQFILRKEILFQRNNIYCALRYFLLSSVASVHVVFLLWLVLLISLSFKSIWVKWGWKTSRYY